MASRLRRVVVIAVFCLTFAAAIIPTFKGVIANQNDILSVYTMCDTTQLANIVKPVLLAAKSFEGKVAAENAEKRKQLLEELENLVRRQRNKKKGSRP